MNLSQIIDLFEIAESIATITGLMAAGYWAYFLFKRHRENYAHIEFLTDIEFHKPMGDWRIAALVAYVENKGMFSIKSAASISI